MKQLMKVILDIEPVTWGSHDAEKRDTLRKEIKKHIPDFGDKFVEIFLRQYQEIEVKIDCYLTNPDSKDIDNLAKIPIDAIFFSAVGESGYRTWESKITFLSITKERSSQNKLAITISGN